MLLRCPLPRSANSGLVSFRGVGRRTVVTLPLVWLSLAFPSHLVGQEADSKPDAIMEAYAETAARIDVRTFDDPEIQFDRVGRSVLNWTNPSRNTAAGSVFFWTHDGRPQVSMCLYPTANGTDYEFQSLAERPLLATAGQAVIWQPAEAGVTWQPFETTVRPGPTALVRLRQLRALARQFSAKLVPPNKNPIPLRLLDTPIYRYGPANVDQPSSDDRIDGAVFTFVQGTDPEVLLLIEAVADDRDSSWRYALARMSMVPTQVHHDNDLVWETNWAIQRFTTPYFVRKNIPELP